MAAAGDPLTTTLMPVPGRLTTATVLNLAASTPSSSARLAVKPSASKVWGVASSSKPSDTLPSPASALLGGGGGGIGACGSTNVLVALVPLPPPAGVALYEHVGGTGGGGRGSGGADGGAQWPSQSTLYSTYTKLPSYASSLTCGVALVTKTYVPSRLTGSSTILAHSKKPRPSTSAPSDELHLPCTLWPLAVVLMMYSSSPSKSVSLTETVR